MGMIRLVNWWRQARWYFIVSVLCGVGISVAAWMHADNPDWFVFLLFILLPAAMVAVGCAYGGRQRRLDWLTPLTVAVCHIALLCCVVPKEQWLQSEYLALFAYACLPGGLLLLVLLFFTVLVPVLGVIWPDMSETIVGLMDGTRLAELLYDDNMILVLIRDLFS